MGILLEPFDVLLPVGRLTVEVFVDDFAIVELLPDDRQQTGELREDQRLMSSINDLVELLEQGFQL
jgi:hypothetical protein